MRSLALGLAALLLLAGCISRGTPDEVTGAELEPTGIEPEATDRPASPATPASSPAPAPAPAAPSAAANATAPNGSAPIEPTPVGVTVTTWDGSFTGAAIYLGDATPIEEGWTAEVEAENAVAEFEVPAGLSAIVVEVAWEQGQVPADLDLRLDAPDVEGLTPPSAGPGGVDSTSGHSWTASEGSPADTTGRAVIVVTDAEALALAGTWSWHVHPKGPANDVVFRVAVTQFLGVLPEDGYSALATPSGNP